MSIVKSYSFPKGDVRGDMFYISHNSDNFTIIDCYLKDGDDESCRKDEILAEIMAQSGKKTITRFISTHPHNDHILGIEALDAQSEIVNFYAVDNAIPANPKDTSLTKYIELRDNAKKCTHIVEGLERCWISKKDENRGSSGIKFLWPKTYVQEYKEALKKVKNGENPNDISCVFTYRIADGPRYMWMGDMEYGMQEVFLREAKDLLKPVDVFFHPHHGRKSSKPPKELLDIIKPKIVVISNAPADDLNYDEPERTITQNTAGDIVFDNDDDAIHIYTQNVYDDAPTCLVKIPGKKDSPAMGYYLGTLKLSE